MTDKTTDELSQEIADLRDEIEGKADSSSLGGLVRKGDLRTGALKGEEGASGGSGEALATQAWVEETTAHSFFQGIKDAEVIIVAAAITAVKLEAASFVNLDPAIEGLLRKINVERNRFGVLWKVKKAELERRRAEAEEGQARLVRMEKGIERLQDLSVQAHRKIRNSNVRIQALEGRVARLTTSSNTVRRQVRHMESSPSLAGTTDRVALLERRIGLLAAALS
ncbi:hypothetical protein [Streptomyces barkulensis]|uniref:hypothetical protein n=1 Tax=Streptomyces barkulensis TaxID=1257026 RepID=UPI000C6D4F21|nr:hypothetical protein [Streptomyces barkulensis]